VFDLAFDNVIRVSVVTHPSILKPEDLDTYLEKSKAPLLVNSYEIDAQFPKEFAATTDEKFAKFEPGYKRTYWEGCNHGFATRGDLTNPVMSFLCQGRRIQGYCRMAYQLFAVKRRCSSQER